MTPPKPNAPHPHRLSSSLLSPLPHPPRKRRRRRYAPTAGQAGVLATDAPRPAFRNKLLSIFADAALHRDNSDTANLITTSTTTAPPALGQMRRLEVVPIARNASDAQHEPQRQSVTSLCALLRCVSLPPTLDSLRTLAHLVTRRVASTAEIAHSLFATSPSVGAGIPLLESSSEDDDSAHHGDNNHDIDDDDDRAASTPSLCVVVRLLRDAVLHLHDLPSNYPLRRSLHELTQDADACSALTAACVCRPTRHAGTRAWLNFLLDTPRCGTSDALLLQYVHVFFHDDRAALGSSARTRRFHLACAVVNHLRDVCTRHGELVDLVVRWVRRAVSPLQFLEAAPARRNMNHVWTPELSGLAGGRPVSEYLMSRQPEQHALTALFSAIPAIDALKVYLEGVGDVIRTVDAHIDDVEGGMDAQIVADGGECDAREPMPGTWSRLVLLGCRIVDSDAHSDVDEGLRRSIVSSITGTLCSPACCSSAFSVAIVLCLARRILIPSLSMMTAKSTSDGSDGSYRGNEGEDGSNADDAAMVHFDRYETWFRDLVSNDAEGTVVDAILTPLAQLVPLEGVRFLKVHHRVLSLSRVHFRRVTDYVALSRARIRDFDPSFARVGSSGSETVRGHGVATGDLMSSRMMNEVVKFVAAFVQSEGKVPVLLIRQMNFHRYHFRKFTLPVLLNADFVTVKPKDGHVVITMDVEAFDDHRIKIIEEIAFKRKDRAITVVEAKKAIKDIKEARSARAARREREQVTGLNIPLASSQVEQASPWRDIVAAVLRDEGDHGLGASQIYNEGKHVDNAKQLLCRNIGNAVLRCRDDEQYATVATDVLQNLCSGIEQERGAREGRDVIDTLTSLSETTGEEVLIGYRDWWMKAGRSLLSLLSHLMVDANVVRVHKHVCYQLFTLMCVRGELLSEQAMLSLSMVLVVLFKVHVDTVLRDLCFIPVESVPEVLRHVSVVTVECLPLSTPQLVKSMTSIVLHCTCLLTTFLDDGLGRSQPCQDGELANDTLNVVPGHASTKEYVKTLASLLRWVVMNPWRLVACADEASNIGSISLTAEANLMHRKAMLVLQEVSSHEASADLLNNILDLEVRATWGSKHAIASLLHALVSSTSSKMSILTKTAAFVAQAEAKRRGRSDWIRSGLILFNDECDGMPGESGGDQSVAQSVTDNVRECGVDVARRMVEMFCVMDVAYFSGCDDIRVHIEDVLVPCMWPFPRRLSIYFLRSLRRYDIDNCPALSPFFVANCIFAHDVYSSGGMQHDHGSSTVDTGKNGPMKQVGEVVCALRNILAGREQGANAAWGDEAGMLPSISQPDASNDAGTRAAYRHPHALGIALALHLTRGMVVRRNAVADGEDVRDEVAAVIANVRAVVGQLVCCDVLDAAVVASGVLHFEAAWDGAGKSSSIVVSSGSGPHRNVKGVLTALVQERVKLCGGECNLLPFWLRIRLRDDSNVDGLAGNDGRRLLTPWRHSLCSHPRRADIAGCSIACTIAALDDGEREDSGGSCGGLDFVLGVIERETIVTAFLPNLVWAFKNAGLAGRSWGVTVRRVLVGVVSQIGVWLRGSGQAAIADRDDTVAAVISSFGQVGAELLAMLEGRGLS